LGKFPLFLTVRIVSQSIFRGKVVGSQKGESIARLIVAAAASNYSGFWFPNKFKHMCVFDAAKCAASQSGAIIRSQRGALRNPG
jgi:hypothetical protein